MAIFGSLNTVREQTRHLTWLHPAYAYLEELFTPGSVAHENLASLPAGETYRRELANGNVALEQVLLTKPRAEGVFETHRRHVDVQVVFAGEEIMEVVDAAKLVVKDEYNPERDAIFYQPAAVGSILRFVPRDAVIYFPADAHKGGLHMEATAVSQLVRKVVIKVPVPE